MGEAARELSLEERGISSNEGKESNLKLVPEQEESKESEASTFEDVQFLNGKIEDFQGAIESLSSEKDIDIVKGTLEGVEERRNELSRNLSDEQMEELGLGQLRFEQLNEIMKSLNQAKSLEGSDEKAIIDEKKDVFGRMERIVEGLDSEGKEELSRKVTEEGIILLGLEEFRVKHIMESLEIMKRAAKAQKDKGKRDIINKYRRILEEKKKVFASHLSTEKRRELGIVGVEKMRDEDIRERYGIKTLEEYEKEAA